MDTINFSKPFDDFSYDLSIKISVDFLEEIVQSFMIHQTTTHFPSSASCPWALMTLNIQEGAQRARAPVTKATHVNPRVDKTKLFL